MKISKTFLFLGIFGALLSAATMGFTFKKQAVPGIQLYTLRDQLPGHVEEVLAKVASAGYKEVEVFGYSRENGFWGLKPEELKKLLDKYHLTTPSGHYGLDQLLNEGKFDDIDEAARVGKILGHQFITIPAISGRFRKSVEDFKNVAAKLNEAGARVKKAGLKLAYHNHDFEFKAIDGITLYEILLKETDPKLVDFEMDLYWMIKGEQNPLTWFANHPGRFKLFHVKDMDPNDPKLNTEVGTGKVPFKEIFAKADQAGIKHYLVEQENFKIDPFQSISTSIANLNKLLQK